MNNNNNNPDAAWVILGGTSAVALAYARRKAVQNQNLILVGRNAKKLSLNAADLDARGSGIIQTLKCDLSDVDKVLENWEKIRTLSPQISGALIAYGVLGVQEDTQENVTSLEHSLRTNFTSAALWSELAFDHFARHGNGQLTIIGSVAGDRGRQSNYHYGAAKGALSIFASGMAHRAARTVGADINVLLVKPGFIDTPMTDHIEKGGPLWASPETVAKNITKAEARGRSTVYAPWFWRFILLLIRHTPNFVFHKTRL